MSDQPSYPDPFAAREESGSSQAGPDAPPSGRQHRPTYQASAPSYQAPSPSYASPEDVQPADPRTLHDADPDAPTPYTAQAGSYTSPFAETTPVPAKPRMVNGQERPMSWRTLLSFACAALAVGFMPIVFGPLAIILAALGQRQGERYSKIAQRAGFICALLGLGLNALSIGTA